MTDKDRLAKTIEYVEWRVLKKDLARGAYIMVSQRLDLLDTAWEIVQDNKPLVQEWLNKGLLYRPTLEELAEWDDTPDMPFRAVITHPFVLIQPAKDH